MTIKHYRPGTYTGDGTRDHEIAGEPMGEMEAWSRRLWYLLQSLLHLLARLVAGVTRRVRLSRLGCAVWRWRAMARYCWTGKCELACGMATFRQIADGTPVDLFVPEAGCPIHDDAPRLLPVPNCIKGAVSLARDLCETAYASYPAEDGDELL